MMLSGSVRQSNGWQRSICCSILLEKQIADMERSFWWEQRFTPVPLWSDRIGYLYEPILGGGFPETGGLILTAAFGCVLWRDLSEAYKIRLTYEVYSHQTELRLLAQKNHYDRLKEQMEETSRVRHDMRQHLRVLSALLEREQYGEMQKYLCRYTREFQERLPIILTVKIRLPMRSYIIMKNYAEKTGSFFSVR